MENKPNNQNKRKRAAGPHRYRDGMPIGINGESTSIHRYVGANTAHVGGSRYVKSRRQLDMEKSGQNSSKAYNPNSKTGNRPGKKTGITPMHGKKASDNANNYNFGNAIPAMPLVPPTIESTKGKAVSVGAVNHIDDSKPAVAPNANKKKKRITFTPLTYVIILGLYVVSAGLSFLRFKVPFLPSFLEVDFSIVPEFIAVVFFGPIAGTGVVLLKNITHMVLFYLEHGEFNFASELSNFVTDFTFIFFAYIAYVIITNNQKSNSIRRSKRVSGVFLAGTSSAIITAFAMLPFHYYLIYPMFVKFFARHGVELNIFSYYLEKIDTLDALWKGMIIFNLPWEFGKLFIVTVLSTAAYYIVTLNEET